MFTCMAHTVPVVTTHFALRGSEVTMIYAHMSRHGCSNKLFLQKLVAGSWTVVTEP